MKKSILIAVAVLLAINSFSQTPNWAWAKSAGGTGKDEANSIATDASGNVYEAGTFNSHSIIFDTITLHNNSSNGVAFLSKYNSNGNIIWAKTASYGQATSIFVDALGYIYVTGAFYGDTMHLDTITLINNLHNGAMFLAKYNANGNIVWAKNADGCINAYGFHVTADTSGNAYVTGHFTASTITFGTFTLTNTSSFTDIFIVKYGSSGNVIWARQSGSDYEDWANSITVSNLGFVYVVGNFSGSTFTVGNYSLNNTTTGNFLDMFIIKYDLNGNLIWAKKEGSTKDVDARSIKIDASGNIFVTGDFYSPSITFGTTTLFNSNVNGVNIFLLEYDANGNVQWAKSATDISTNGVGPTELLLDSSGNIYVSGYYANQNVSFGPITFTNDSVGYSDCFIAKFNSTGNILWGKTFGGKLDDVPNSMALDNDNNIYVDGNFNSSKIIINTDTLVNSFTFYPNCYIAKLSMTTGIQEINKTLSSFQIYPNPFTYQTTISFSEEQKNTKMKIIDILGNEIKTLNFTGRQLVIDKAEMKSGIYFVQITDEKKIISNKKIIIL